jgi:D-alanine-D-alanine ligase
MSEEKISVAVVYNHAGEDVYEKIKQVDPALLGFEPEYDIHVASVEEEYKAIVKALRREGFKARAVNIKEDIKKLHSLVRRNRPDVIVNLVEHFHDDSELEPAVAAFFDLHEVPYTGAPPFSLSLCHKKGLAKQVLLENGVPTPRFRLLRGPQISTRHGLHYPLIVKPSRSDASMGVEAGSVVHDHDQLIKQLERVFGEFDPPILVEEFIEGRELHISILGNDPPAMLPIIEFDFSDLPPEHPAIISYDAKWNPLDEVYHRVHTICPAQLSQRALEKVEDVALQAYAITGCRDYARLDIRLAKRNQPFVLEVNPNPDLTEGVSFMEAAEVGGYTFAETLGKIVDYALERAPEPEEPEPTQREAEIRIPQAMREQLATTPRPQPK